MQLVEAHYRYLLGPLVHNSFRQPFSLEKIAVFNVGLNGEADADLPQPPFTASPRPIRVSCPTAGGNLGICAFH